MVLPVNVPEPAQYKHSSPFVKATLLTMDGGDSWQLVVKKDGKEILFTRYFDKEDSRRAGADYHVRYGYSDPQTIYSDAVWKMFGELNRAESRNAGNRFVGANFRQVKVGQVSRSYIDYMMSELERLK